MIDTQFMFASEGREKLEISISEKRVCSLRPYVVSVPNGIILPLKAGVPGLSWGGGGVLDKNGEFVKESSVETAFGSPYPFNQTDVLFFNEDVIYIPVIPNHWGHFLINCLCRFWNDKLFESNLKIAFCGYKWKQEQIGAQYLQALEALGISPKRLFFVNRPVRFRMVFIPSETFGYAADYSPEFRLIAEKIVNSVLGTPDFRGLAPLDKIYFTRRHFLKSKFNEFGESIIEHIFKKNGFVVLSPEKLSFPEQVFYFSHAKEIACLSGTIPHNAIFMFPNSHLFIINRTSEFNPPQAKISTFFLIDTCYIDAFCTYILHHPIHYGDGPFWVLPNKNFRRFLKAHHLRFPLLDFLKLPFLNFINFFKFYLTLFLIRPFYSWAKKAISFFR